MITTILVVAITVIGIILIRVSYEFSAANAIGILLTAGGGICTVVVVLLIISDHVGVEAAVEENRIVYESLCERNEIISSDYEDVSKSDVIEDIAEWNKMVYRYKYWAYNPWTNWFHSKRVADELQMIERRIVMTDKLKKLIEDELESAYAQGRAETEAKYYDALLIAKSKAYDQGLSEGKRINKKLCNECKYLHQDSLNYPRRGCKNNYPNLLEPAEKIDNEIRFGDEVVDNDGEKGIVVTKDNSNRTSLYVLFNGYDVPQSVFKRDYKKTGKHYDLDSYMEVLKG